MKNKYIHIYTIRNILLITVLLPLIHGCELKQKDYVKGEEFIKIYNDSETAKKYYPSGVMQTSDNGYIVVSGIKYDTAETEFPNTSVFKADEYGKLEWSNESQWFAPVNKIYSAGNKTGFIAMDGGLEGSLAIIDPESGEITDVYGLGLTMPLAFYSDDEQLVVLGYNYISRSSIIKIYNTSTLQQLNSIELTVNSDVRNLIQRHLNKSGEMFPFFIGKWEQGNNKGYYVNCFANYTLRVVFLNESGSLTGGDIYSFQTESAISSLINKDENTYALTRYYKGENYINTDIEVNTSSSQNFNEYTGSPLYELVTNAPVTVNRRITGNDSTMIFTSHTNENSVQFYQFTINTPELVNSFDISFNQKVELCDAIITSDNGMIALARVFVTGKFPRPVLVKVPPMNFKQ